MARRHVYALIVSYLTAIVVGIGCILYADYVNGKSDQRWCSLLVRLDNSYKENPPGTDLGKSLSTDFSALRKAFQCNE